MHTFFQMKFRLVLFLMFSLVCATVSCTTKNETSFPDSTDSSQIVKKQLYLADPTIFYHNGTYYLYGTRTVKEGFVVYTSKNLKDWKGPAGAQDGFALHEEDVYGSSGFWAPQIFEYQGKFYMAYTANEHIAIAKSDSPLGPFTQEVKKPLIAGIKNIDPYVFIAEDETKYLYHVRLHQGNRIYVVQMTDDFNNVKPNTLTSTINAVEHPQPWENVGNNDWPVTEGPTVLKHNGSYYMFYSANGYTSIHYAAGYATADSLLGPWKKYKENPILSRDVLGENGPGHGDFFQDSSGQYYYVFHTHYSNAKVHPRRTAIIKGDFVPQKNGPDKMVFNSNSFHYLKKIVNL